MANISPSVGSLPVYHPPAPVANTTLEQVSRRPGTSPVAYTPITIPRTPNSLDLIALTPIQLPRTLDALGGRAFSPIPLPHPVDNRSYTPIQLPRTLDAIDPAGYLSDLLTELHQLKKTGGGDTTRAVLHAESIIPEMLAILNGHGSQVRLQELEGQLEDDLVVVRKIKP